MQQVMYAENPQNVLTYFDYLQAVNTERWQGWTPYYDEGGPVFYNGMIQSYLNVGPKARRRAAGRAAAAQHGADRRHRGRSCWSSQASRAGGWSRGAGGASAAEATRELRSRQCCRPRRRGNTSPK